MLQWNISVSKNVTIALCFATTVAVHVPIGLAQSEAQIAKIFESFDVNHDGKISHSEFSLKKILVMTARDKNYNGSLSRDEVLISDEKFASVDKNNDGEVSSLEFIDGGLGKFENIDRNRDRVLVINELTSWLKGTK